MNCGLFKGIRETRRSHPNRKSKPTVGKTVTSAREKDWPARQEFGPSLTETWELRQKHVGAGAARSLRHGYLAEVALPQFELSDESFLVPRASRVVPLRFRDEPVIVDHGVFKGKTETGTY